jgi:hypothetical protein
MLASDIISRAQTLLQDADGTRWTSTELLKWISDGQRVIALVRPDSCSTHTALSLAAGSKQSLPAGGLRLLDVIRNLSESGIVGRAVRMVDRETLDAQDPNWHRAASTGSVYNFAYDNRDPLNFYVYPPALPGKKLEIVYVKSPEEINSSTDPIGLLDIYAEPLLNYVMFRAYSKDAEYGANAQLATGYFTVFSNLLGIKTGKDFAFSPDANKPGGTPNPIAAQAGGV